MTRRTPSLGFLMLPAKRGITDNENQKPFEQQIYRSSYRYCNYLEQTPILLSIVIDQLHYPGQLSHLALT
jgi:hypothetical protein